MEKSVRQNDNMHGLTFMIQCAIFVFYTLYDLTTIATCDCGRDVENTE